MAQPDERPERDKPFLTLITKWFVIIIWEHPGWALSAIITGGCVVSFLIGVMHIK